MINSIMNNYDIIYIIKYLIFNIMKMQKKETIFIKDEQVTEEEFRKFMELKSKEKIEKCITCKHIWYDTVILWTKKFLYEILEDKKWGTTMYNIKKIENI